ncbi:putative acetyltransferase [Bacillus sp. TS-2]|nr:putative acetyltransferase [Bacillus sp. TS-2]
MFNFISNPPPSFSDLEAFVKSFFQSEKGIQFIALQNHHIVGFATLYFTYSTLKVAPVTIMNDLFVIEDKRGMGIARQLFQACQQYTCTHQFAYMSWITAKENKEAQRFYQKLGAQKGNWVGYMI